jgi:hypothetical protein
MMPIRSSRTDNQLPAAEGPAPEPVTPVPSVYRWYHKMSVVLVVTLCVEIGLFLLIFPWTDYWEANYFGQLAPKLHNYWYNGYVRGAVSGLGAVNLYIALMEVLRLRRFAKRSGPLAR